MIHQEARQNNNRQNPIHDGYQAVGVWEEAINMTNQPHMQNIHWEHSNDERNTWSDRQFFTPQGERPQMCDRKSKVV